MKVAELLEKMHGWIVSITSYASPAAATLARLTVGYEFVTSGLGKVGNLEQVSGYFASLNIPMPELNALMASYTELLCGGLLLAGLFTRLAAIPLIVTMIVALLTAKRQVLLPLQGNEAGAPELNSVSALVSMVEFTYIALLAWIAAAGPGPLSLDRLIWRYIRRAQ